MRNLTPTAISPFPSSYPLNLSREYLSKTPSELERILYIEGNPLHQILTMKPVGGDKAAYDKNLKAMKDFAIKTGEDLGLPPEEVLSCLPVLVEISSEDQPDLF